MSLENLVKGQTLFPKGQAKYIKFIKNKVQNILKNMTIIPSTSIIFLYYHNHHQPLFAIINHRRPSLIILARDNFLTTTIDREIFWQDSQVT